MLDPIALPRELANGLRSQVSRRRRHRSKSGRRHRVLRPAVEAAEARTLLATSAVGTLDPTFNADGIVNVTQEASTGIAVYGMNLDSQGRTIVLGTGFVERYTQDGVPDSSFGALGVVQLPNSSPWFGVGPDGSVVDVGFDTNSDAFVEKLDPHGTPDIGFGTGGVSAPIVFTSGGKTGSFVDGQPSIVAGGPLVFPDGRILVVGDITVGTGDGLAMLLPDGTPDESFHRTGTFIDIADPAFPTASFQPLQAAVSGDQFYVLSQNDTPGNGEGYLIQRFNENGALDTSFGSGGLVKVSNPFLKPVDVGANNAQFSGMLAIAPDGKIVIARGDDSSGFSPTDPELVTRYNVDGTVDTSFGTQGMVTLPGIAVFVNTIAVQPNGKIVLSNFSATETNLGPDLTNSTLQLERLNTNGSADTSFGPRGTVTYWGPPGGSAPEELAIGPTGRILVLSSEGQIFGIVGDPVVSFTGATSYSSSGTPTAVYQVSETAGAATITLQRGGDLSQPLSVPFSTDDSGGDADIHYKPVNTNVEFAAGSATATVTIPILVDPHVSSAVDIPLRLGTPPGAAALGTYAVGDLRIEPTEGISVTPSQLPSVMQGEGSGSTFAVALESVPTANVTIPLSISSTSPAATLSTSALVFTPANALVPQTVTVMAAGTSGSAVTTPPVATIALGAATSTDPRYSGLVGGTATVGVYPNASGPGSIEFAAPNFTVDENAGTATITLVRLGGSTVPVSVHFETADGSNRASGKYTPLTGSISFASGVTSRTFKITLVDPGHNFQGDQTVDLTLSNPPGGAKLGRFPTATLTLHDPSVLSA